MPCDIEGIWREHCEAFVQDQLDRHSASTASTHYRGRQRFFGWAEDEGEIDISPMRRMRPPKFEERIPDVLEVDDLRRLMDACRGWAFEARRNLAVPLLLIDTGMRRGEVAAVRYADLDLDQGLLRVMGKGGRSPRRPDWPPWKLGSVDWHTSALGDVAQWRPRQSGANSWRLGLRNPRPSNQSVAGSNPAGGAAVLK